MRRTKMAACIDMITIGVAHRHCGELHDPWYYGNIWLWCHRCYDVGFTAMIWDSGAVPRNHSMYAAILVLLIFFLEFSNVNTGKCYIVELSNPEWICDNKSNALGDIDSIIQGSGQKLKCFIWSVWKRTKNECSVVESEDWKTVLSAFCSLYNILEREMKLMIMKEVLLRKIKCLEISFMTKLGPSYHSKLIDA